jgi:uncharacterized membrane protein YeaQ/YmgE (transglycosylase-associated protein family)
MLVQASTITALAVVGGVGAITGLLGGFISSANNLIGTMLMGVIGAIGLSAVFRLAEVPGVYSVGAEGFSVVWGALGGLVLAYVVGRSNT